MKSQKPTIKQVDSKIKVIDISNAFNVLFSLKDISIKNARFSHEISMLRKQLEPIAESYQQEIFNLYNKYGTNNGSGKWSFAKENFENLNNEMQDLNDATHSINKIKGIDKEFIFEIPDLALPSTFWDLVFDKFFE